MITMNASSIALEMYQVVLCAVFLNVCMYTYTCVYMFYFILIDVKSATIPALFYFIFS